MEPHDDNLWGEPIFRYTRAQALTDGILVDLTTATDGQGQLLCRQAGFKIPVAITKATWSKTIEAGGTWKGDGDSDVLELRGGQSLMGRLWDVLWMLRMACGRSGDNDRVHFQVLVDVNRDDRREAVKLWALCGPLGTMASRSLQSSWRGSTEAVGSTRFSCHFLSAVFACRNSFALNEKLAISCGYV